MTEPDDFERRAAERVVELGNDDHPIDLGTFAAMFDLFRVSARVVGDLESARPMGVEPALKLRHQTVTRIHSVAGGKAVAEGHDARLGVDLCRNCQKYAEYDKK